MEDELGVALDLAIVLPSPPSDGLSIEWLAKARGLMEGAIDHEIDEVCKFDPLVRDQFARIDFASTRGRIVSTAIDQKLRSSILDVGS